MAVPPQSLVTHLMAHSTLPQRGLAQPLNQFIATAIREKLARSEASLKQLMAILELEDCVESYVGLTTILAEKTEDRGLMSLANNATVKLLRDLTAVSEAFKSGAIASVGSEVAS